MGNTQEGQSFEDWLRVAIASKRWSIADLSREIARREGKDERDVEDFNRRAKAIHNNISNALNGVSNFGEVYIRKIADALGVPQESALRIAGKLGDDHDEAVQVPTTTRGKIEALLASLTPDEQDEAIRFFGELYTLTNCGAAASKAQEKHAETDVM